MARIAQGPGVRAVPILTKGLTDQIWLTNGEASQVDGCYFQVVGSVEKAKAGRNLVDWSWLTPHLLNTRINAITSFQVRGGPAELVVSLSGDTGDAEPHYPDLASLDPSLITDGSVTKDKYRAGRILVVRCDNLEHKNLPHIGEGSPWEESYSTNPEGDRFIAARRVDPEDQFGGDYFANWGGYLFIVNGVDANLKWNGDYTSRGGVSARPAPPKALAITPPQTALVRNIGAPFDGKYAPYQADRSNESIVLDPDFSINDEFVGIGEGDRGNASSVVQKFQYRATFVSESGAEGPPSAPGEFATTGEVYKFAHFNDTRPTSVGIHCWIEERVNPQDSTGGTPLTRNPHRALIHITGLDRPSQPDIVWRNIYKRARDGVFYFWRQVSVNERVIYDHEDTLESAAMGSPLHEGLQAPPTSKFVAFFRGRAYYVSPENPSLVFYSDQDLPEQMSSGLQFMDVNSSDGSVVTGMVSFEDSLIIFKDSSLWQITALADGSPILTPVDESIGSVSPRAAIRAYERLVFVGRDGVYQYNGGSVKPLSAGLNMWWKNAYLGGLHTATSWLDEKERRLFISLQTGPDDVNDTVICYHYQLDAITIIKGQKITAATRYKGESILAVQFDEKELRPDKGKPGEPVREAEGAESWLSGKKTRPKKKGDPIRNSDLVIWDLGGSYSYEYSPGVIKGARDTVSAGSCAGRIRFGPYSANQTGWDSGEEMEVAGIDVFFPYAGDHTVTVKGYQNRNPVAEGSRPVNLNESGTSAQNDMNTDLVPEAGWDGTDKTWNSSTWSGDQQLFQRLVFRDSVVCREIEIEFSNSEENEPFRLDGFVLWRTSKGSERQR